MWGFECHYYFNSYWRLGLSSPRLSVKFLLRTWICNNVKKTNIVFAIAKILNCEGNSPSIHCSMGSAPIGAQCPLTSSPGEFLGYWDWLWYPGLSPVLVSIALPFHISVFSIHSSSPAIGFHSSIFHGGGICTPPPTLLLIPDWDWHYGNWISEKVEIPRWWSLSIYRLWNSPESLSYIIDFHSVP